MPNRKFELSRPKRLQERLLKLVKEANSTAELLAELAVAVQDVSRAALRLHDELEEEVKT